MPVIGQRENTVATNELAQRCFFLDILECRNPLVCYSTQFHAQCMNLSRPGSLSRWCRGPPGYSIYSWPQNYSYPSWFLINIFLCGSENVLPSVFVIYGWPFMGVDWITKISKCRNIHFQRYLIHISLKTVMFIIIHALVHHFLQ